jgi:hypothetical protein
MKFARVVWLIAAASACSRSEGAPESMVKSSSNEPAVAAAEMPALVPLETLITALDTARGFYFPHTPRQLELTNANLQIDAFRAHGRSAVQPLINCMTDSTTTATYHGDNMRYKYPRGVLCYEVLRAIVDYDQSRYLPINRQDVYVGMEGWNIEAELRRAQRAWQIIHDARAFRMHTPTK